MIIKNKPKLPGSLQPGDTVGVVAPAGSFDRGQFGAGVAILEGMGYKVSVPEAIFRRESYLAGTDAQRACVLNGMFSDPDVKAVFCARGGYGSLRILPLLDYGMIEQNPKIVVGFSDISALLSALVLRCGFVCFHGPVVTALADASDDTLEGLSRVLGHQPAEGLTGEDSEVLFHGEARGMSAGGNLTTLCHLVGTGFSPDYSGKILFIEDVGEAPYRIDRMLSHMKLAGCFEGISGVVLGGFDRCGDYAKIQVIAADIFKDFNIPVVSGGRFGHGACNIAFPIGMDLSLDTSDMSLSFLNDEFS